MTVSCFESGGGCLLNLHTYISGTMRRVDLRLGEFDLISMVTVVLNKA